MADDYRIGAGHDVALGSLTLITNITPVGDVAFAMPRATPLYDPGETHMRLSVLPYNSGYPSVIWRFGVLTFAQWVYLSTTYCGGGLGGLVTVYTDLGDNATFVRRNASMILKKPIEMGGDKPWYVPSDVTMIITGVAA